MARRKKNEDTAEFASAGGGASTATVGIGGAGGAPAEDEARAADAAGDRAASAVAADETGDGGASDGAKQKTEQARDEAKQKAEQARDGAKQKAEQAREKLSGATGDVQGSAQEAVAKAEEGFEQRPEVFVGAAFLGGFVLAKLIGALGGGDD